MDLLTDVERHMRGLDTQELQRLVAINDGSYTREALGLAVAELKRRKEAVMPPEEYRTRFPEVPAGFCSKCIQETTDESPGDTDIHHALLGLLRIGTQLAGNQDLCPACGSLIQSRWLWLFVPVGRLGRFRVIYPHGRDGMVVNYLGRRMSDSKRGWIERIYTNKWTSHSVNAVLIATLVFGGFVWITNRWGGAREARDRQVLEERAASRQAAQPPEDLKIVGGMEVVEVVHETPATRACVRAIIEHAKRQSPDG